MYLRRELVLISKKYPMSSLNLIEKGQDAENIIEDTEKSLFDLAGKR